MASAATASPIVQPDLVVEQKPSRIRSWKSISNLFGSMKLKPATEVPGDPRPSVSESACTESTAVQSIEAGPLALNKSMTDASDTCEGSVVIGPDDDKAGDQIVDRAAAFVDADEKVPDDLPPLPKPILLPRLQRGSTAPLVRAWPPEAANHAIKSDDFIAFIDNLNIVSTEPPVTSVLLVAAIGISFIPWDGADGIAALTELSAIALAHAIVARRCKRYLEKMNESYFHHRKLHARLVTTKRMKKSVGIAKEDPLVAPLSEEILAMTAYDRCMSSLKEHSCELSYDVPDSSNATKLLERFAAWKVRHDVAQFDKMAMRLRKRAWKKHLKKGKTSKREGFCERSRVKNLQWLLVQNLDEFELEEAERIKLAEEKKAKRSFSWKSQASTISKDESVVKT